LDKSALVIRKLEINEELVSAGEYSTQGVMLIPPGVVDILPFQQVITKFEIPTLRASAVIDGRTLLRADGRPVKEDALRHATFVADLTVMWYTQGDSFKRDLLNVGDFPAKVFISWVSSISQRLGLDLGQSTLVRAMLAIYYVQMFAPLPENPDISDIDRVMVRASRLLPAMDPNTLQGALGEIPRLEKLKDLVDWIIRTLESPRTESLTVAFVYTALGHTFGPTLREAAAVALEYPPMLISMIYTTCRERSYTRTGLGRVIEVVIRNGSDKEFVKNMNHLTGKR
jgi:hypothetical protein